MQILPIMPLMIMMVVMMSCAGLPESSRSGQTLRVSITDQDISPKDLTVQSGDEIMFLNRGPTRVWMYFANEYWNELSCRRGFSYFWGIEESAAVQPNESVSLCFLRPGTYGYWVQSLRTDRGGAPQGQLSIRDAMPGAIVVTGPQ